MVSGYSIAALLVAGAIVGFFWWRKLYIVQGLVLANFGVFFVTIAAGLAYGAPFGHITGTPLLTELAFKPEDLASANPVGWLRIITAAFLHASPLHILANMIVLIMVGLAFEDRVGRGRFLGIYLFTAVTAVLLHVPYTWLTRGDSALAIPLVGASGAVFGILGAFATMYPHDRIPMWLIFIVLPRVPVIVAAIVLMLLEGLLLFGGAVDSVARAAHLGGAVGGAAIGPLLKPAGMGPGGRRIVHYDIESLAARAVTPQQQRYVARLRDNLDEPETAEAWFDRLVETLECTECGAGYSQTRGGRARCPNGHEDRYDAKS